MKPDWKDAPEWYWHEDKMKPDWKDAPEWANYLAMDSDGEWYWHEDKPNFGRGEWFNGGRVREAVLVAYNWEDSLEERVKDE